RFLESLVPFEGAVIADIGAGGGCHACRYAARAARVFAVEPAPKMLRQLYARVAATGFSNISIVTADAEAVPLPDGLVDLVHNRFAYFFGPVPGTTNDCERGIREALRILKPGGLFFIIDNALASGQFAGILARYGYVRGLDPAEAQRRNDDFYAARGFQ